MGTSIFAPLLLLLLACTAMAAEKVLFGEPAPLPAEGKQSAADSAAAAAAKEAKPKSGGRNARVFTFPQQDSRTLQPAYVIPSPYDHDIQDRYSSGAAAAAAASAAEDESRLLSLLPTFGDNGMQVGLDFKLPFFSVPYAKMFSALSSAPSLPSIFGGGLSGSPYGATGASALSTNLLGSGSGLATAAAMAVTAALLYPKVTGLFGLNANKGLSFRDGGSADDFFHNLNQVLGQFNVDGESCMKVALCSVGKVRRQQRTRARDPSGGSTYADVLEEVINLPAVKKVLNKGGLTQARDFGGSGGDCDYFNDQKKCPIGMETFNKYLSSLG